MDEGCESKSQELGSVWPDIVVGVGIALLFLRTAAGVLRASVAELARLRRPSLPGAPG